MSQILNFSYFVNAAPAEAFRAFTHPTALSDWLCDQASSTARLGGPFQLWWEDGYFAAGVFTTFAPGQALGFSWLSPADPGPSQVQVMFAPQAEGTLVTLTHSGMGEGPEWAETRRSVDYGWKSGLENLKSLLETGLDLRVIRRPRLGIMLAEFSPQVAQKLGAPLESGILIAGTAEGSGARAAGLLENDILVSLNGKPALDMPSLHHALEGLHAGDQPVVEFYRGASRLRAALTLGHFPQPEIPASAAELAEKARQAYAGMVNGLGQLLEGVGDGEAFQRPAEGAWSVAEIVGHLILCERDYQAQVADMLNDAAIRVENDLRPNVNVRIAALLARCPSLAAVLEELKLSTQESVELLACLPQDFINKRRHIYNRAAGWVLSTVADHYNDHAAQFKAALAAVQKR